MPDSDSVGRGVRIEALASDSPQPGPGGPWSQIDTVQFIRRLAYRMSNMHPILAGAQGHGSTGRRVPPRPYAWRVLRESRRRASAREHAAALRAMLQDYGSFLRASGVAPERVVPRVRHAVQCAIEASGIAGEQSTRLVDLGVLWGIEGYYRAHNDVVRAPTGRAQSESSADVPLERV